MIKFLARFGFGKILRNLTFEENRYQNMVRHSELGENKEERKRRLAKLIKEGAVTLGGYRKAKIYGTLRCGSGKQMKYENRVFFESELEALGEGYRPCGNCLPEKYKLWKAGENWI